MYLFSIASSEEDDDDIFSDDLAEHVSDSESGGEEQVRTWKLKIEAYYCIALCTGVCRSSCS